MANCVTENCKISTVTDDEEFSRWLATHPMCDIGMNLEEGITPFKDLYKMCTTCQFKIPLHGTECIGHIIDPVGNRNPLDRKKSKESFKQKESEIFLYLSEREYT